MGRLGLVRTGKRGDPSLTPLPLTAESLLTAANAAARKMSVYETRWIWKYPDKNRGIGEKESKYRNAL